MVQKFKLDFTPSVNLGPIIVDIVTKNKIKIDVPAGTGLAMPAFHTQVIFYLSLSDIPFCTFLPTLMCHRATHFPYQHFLRTVIL